MKKIKILLVMIVAMASFNSCEKDELVFTAQAPGEFTFTNNFLSEYILTSTTSANIGERFTWESQSFDVETAVTYELQGSVLGDFTDTEVIGSTSSNDIAVTVGKLLSMASAAGLDNDPNTEEPNTGSLYFRLRAYSGNSAIETLSAVQALTVVLPEIVDNGGGSGITISSWGVVGSGYNNWGAFEDGNFYSTGTADVYVAYVTLVDGAIKFRENNAWDNNLGDDGADGTLESGGADIVVTAGTYKITLDLGANTYTMEPYSWGVVGSAYNNWGADGPDAKFYYDYTTDTFKVGVRLLDGAMKVRFNNDWATNFGDTGADGTLDEGGDDIVVTAGHYLITIDLNANTYTAVTTDVPGVVGSAYNNWGADGPDFSLTEISAGLYVGDIITLVDGAFKFRMNNDWAVNYGDTGADGTIDEGGDDIVATAGMYRVILNTTEGTYKLNPLQ
ncbi:SusE domain-containing protein [Sabulilitoribacter multivorans]|uniref:SusE domain-containing protein n=1 Tax=Flaviramulus multivorans TaxID=1304750 RepID=A0ABS9ILJ5_9FLAO|nr:SusE domain-containing protein [Flaviramulus multivorans]MCF7561468.1 SusE domain-containing protein [Flaviramulus multivorans]